MEDGPKKLPVIFYRTPGGAEPVRDWLNGLPQEDRRTLGHDIGNVEYGWLAGRNAALPVPWRRVVGGASNLPSHRTARVIFCTAQGRMVLLHGFIKRTQKTPQPDLELARRRQKEIEQ
jgi:phage-related protein